MTPAMSRISAKSWSNVEVLALLTVAKLPVSISTPTPMTIQLMAVTPVVVFEWCYGSLYHGPVLYIAQILGTVVRGRRV